MSRRSAKPAKYEVVFLPDVLTLDLPVIAAVDVALLDAVSIAVDDLAHGRQRGKALSERRTSPVSSAVGCRATGVVGDRFPEAVEAGAEQLEVEVALVFDLPGQSYEQPSSRSGGV